jgi:hypothetical protein
MKRGTSRFEPSIADVVCERVARGERLMRICAEPGMPSVQTIYVWRRSQEAFKEKLERAKNFSQVESGTQRATSGLANQTAAPADEQSDRTGFLVGSRSSDLYQS